MHSQTSAAMVSVTAKNVFIVFMVDAFLTLSSSIAVERNVRHSLAVVFHTHIQRNCASGEWSENVNKGESDIGFIHSFIYSNRCSGSRWIRSVFWEYWARDRNPPLVQNEGKNCRVLPLCQEI